MDFTTQEWFYAVAYQNQDFINIETHSGYRRKAADPDGVQILLPPDASNEDLGKATLAALSKSRIIDISEIGTFFDLDNTMKNYNNWVADLMNKYGYKTKRALFKNMMSCSIEIRNGVLTLSPTHHEKLEAWGRVKGLTDFEKVVLPINSTAEEIGAGLRLAFSRCR